MFRRFSLKIELMLGIIFSRFTCSEWYCRYEPDKMNHLFINCGTMDRFILLFNLR